MIFGRPTNLILGAFTGTFNVIVLVLATQGIVIDASIVGAVNLAAAAIVALVANQPPTVLPGDTVTIQTPKGEPNREVTV